jgi:hypothetical protein
VFLFRVVTVAFLGLAQKKGREIPSYKKLNTTYWKEITYTEMRKGVLIFKSWNPL